MAHLRMILALATLAAIYSSQTHAVPAANGQQCAGIEASTERLACYDEAFPPRLDPAARAAALQAKREKAQREFGLNRLQVDSRQPEETRRMVTKQIQGKIADVFSNAVGERTVRLESGQVWRITDASSKGYLRVGDPVVIRSAALASFLLVTPGHVALRARRVN